MAVQGIDGATVLLLVDDGSGSFVSVAAQTGLSHENSRTMIDASNKDKDHVKYIYGKQDGTITLDSLYVPNDSAFGYLENAINNKSEIVVRRSEDGTAIEETTALVTSISKDYPDNDVATCTAELNLNEAWSSVP